MAAMRSVVALKAPNLHLKERRDRRLSNGAGPILLRYLEFSPIAFTVLTFFQGTDDFLKVNREWKG